MNEATKTLKTRINFCALPEDYSDAQPTEGRHEVPEESFDHAETLKKRSKRTRTRSDEEYDDDPLLHVEAKLKKETINVATEDFDEDYDGRSNRPKRPKNYNMSAENLDFNLTFVKTQSSRDQLIHESYTYNQIDSQQSGCEAVRWKCTLSQKRGCRGKVTTALNNSCVLIDKRTDHNHKPKTEDRVLVIKFKDEIKRIVCNHPDMKTSEILASARMLLGTDLPLGLKSASITRLIQRWRSDQKKKVEMHTQEGNTMSEEGEADFSPSLSS